MKYDDASWHYGGEFPVDSPPEYGATHIALFLKWCFIKGWIGDMHLEEEPEDTERLIQGTLSATEYFLKYCDETLTDEDLNEEGNVFAEQYYGKNGLYLQDYIDHFSDLAYVAPEENHDFQLFSSILEARYQSGILTESQT
ncbi:hypothetical protein [Acaryochloris sp. CCMEE 5410]|uniref:DUF7832 domain-containing protein n=1 Tax=Acaryochloris sp. CCMEE 5410 TaxID=310037 RepID=UPI0002484155|nr:hypothetical protein [Acaryochloris sp. CCMEE 5410]KAI9133885.1 hypothetical protein ON05_011650 [Acaryochloris sp. CCMEE 5410]